jgi:NAD-dependent dihydropyrimidine dehydrogenase PreA subunit
MAYVIADTCSGKDTACADACPVQCIYPKKRLSAKSKAGLYVDAEQCIDCGACALACPENVIFSAPGRGWYGEDFLPAKNQVIKAQFTLHANESDDKDVTLTVEIPMSQGVLHSDLH